MDVVVGCSSHGITAGERIGAGNVQVILQRDQLRGPVRVAQGIESEVRGDARAALRAGEELEQDDAVMMRVGAARVRIWLERFECPFFSSASRCFSCCNRDSVSLAMSALADRRAASIRRDSAQTRSSVVASLARSRKAAWAIFRSSGAYRGSENSATAWRTLAMNASDLPNPGVGSGT